MQVKLQLLLELLLSPVMLKIVTRERDALLCSSRDEIYQARETPHMEDEHEDERG